MQGEKQDKKIKKIVSQGKWQGLVKGMVKVEKRMKFAITQRGENVKVMSLGKVSMMEGTKDVKLIGIGQEKAKEKVFLKSPNEVEKKDSAMVRTKSCPWMTRLVEG